MDPLQFQQLLDTFTQTIILNQQTLIEQLTSRQIPNPSSTPESLINICTFEHYEANKENFSCYIERFENYVAVKNVTSKIKRAQLLNASIGSTHYNNLSAFMGPDKLLKELTYEELVQAYSRMLSPVKNVVVSQHYFFSCYQDDKQTIAEYVSKLQRNLIECDFYIQCTCDRKVSIAEVFLRTQFIRGIRDNWIREQLFQSNVTNPTERICQRGIVR